jgi:hypothetical protein
MDEQEKLPLVLQLWNGESATLHSMSASRISGLFVSSRQVWNVINYIAIALCLLFGARGLWETPTLETFLTLTLAMMCIVLLLTPWFFPWYIIWIVGLGSCVLTSSSRPRYCGVFYPGADLQLLDAITLPVQSRSAWPEYLSGEPVRHSTADLRFSPLLDVVSSFALDHSMTSACILNAAFVQLIPYIRLRKFHL